MRGIRAFNADTGGIGGFTEAVLAMIVVTLAVVLFSASLSFSGIEMMEKGEDASKSEICEGIWNAVKDDEMLWDGDAAVLSSFESRAMAPYAVPDGSFGFEIALVCMSGNTSEVDIFGGMAVDGADMHAERHPILIRTDSGMCPGMIEVRVW